VLVFLTHGISQFCIRQLIEFPDDMVLTEIPSGQKMSLKLQLRHGMLAVLIGEAANHSGIRAFSSSAGATASGHPEILE